MVAAALFVPAWAGYKQINGPNPDDLLNAQIFQLDNGLTVYLTENHDTQRFYSKISVRAGSKSDPAETTGLAHYLEHLLFKGTANMGTLDYEKEKSYIEKITALYEEHFKEDDPEKRKAIYAEINSVSQEAAQYAIANEIDKLFNDMGGHAVNAHTWHEETVYEESLPANRLEQWAVIEAERFSHPVFRLFHTELETVYEEKNRSMDNKDVIIDEAVNNLLYKVHPYGQQTTIGTVEDLKRPSLVNIQNYFDTYYVPNNMAIAVSGDIDIDKTIKLIDEHFSAWKRKPLPEAREWKEAPLKDAERVTVKYQGEEYVMLAFRTVGNQHEDTPALRLVDMILDNATAGLINLNLNQQQRVRQAGTYPAVMNDYGSEQLWGVPKEGQTLEEVEKLLLEQLELLKKGEFEDWILGAILTDFKKNRKAALESDIARVNGMTQAFIANMDWDYAVGEIERMERVTKKDVIRVANKYFGDDYVAGYRLDEQHEVPSIEKPKIDPVDIDPRRQSEFAKKVLAIPYTPLEPVFVDAKKDVTIIDDPKGVKFYHSKNPLNDLFTLTFSVEFGTYEDNKIGIATQLLDKSGAGKYSPEDLKKEWYKLGCDFGVSAGDNESFVGLSGLDENFERAVELLMTVMTDPKVDDAVLEELKQIILVQREDSKKDPGTIGSALSSYHRYGDESYFLRLLQKEKLLGLSVAELHQSIKDLLKYKHTISYVGSLSPEKVLEIVKKHAPEMGELKDTPPYRFYRAKAADKTEIYFFDKELAQATVRIEFPDGVFDEGANTGMELYNAYFAGGMSGIVFQELREARALAYSAGARYAPGSRINDENLMIGAIGCQADKTPEAVQAFLDLFDNLPESPERFGESVNGILNTYRASKTGFRSVIGAVRSWERLGLQPDPRVKRYEGLQHIEIGDLMNFHAEHIKGRPKLISIVGDKKKMDMETLAKYGTIIDVTADKIFVD